MRFVVSGSTGFLGTALRAALADQGHEVIRLVRGNALGVDVSRWDPATGHLDQSVIESADVVVNVAGAPILRPWTRSRRDLIRSSRVDSTRTLARAIARCDHPPAFLAQSGTDVYGQGNGDRVLDEYAAAGAPSFLQRVTQECEEASAEAAEAGARVCDLRTGAVVDRHSGTLKVMLPFFRLGLGGPVADGSQYFPVISLRDWVGAVLHLADSETARGPFNLAAPEPPTNAEFTAALADTLRRPAVLFLPAPVVKIAGDLSNLLLNSVRAVPAKLEADGYRFRDRTVDEVVAEALR